MSKRIIKLGTWDGKPIEWIVLKEENRCLLLLSKKILFTSKYDDNSNNWCQSYICKYLNNEFYDVAFSTPEKKRIINAKLEDVQNVKNDVFLLSIEETNNYLTTEEQRDFTTEIIDYWRLRSSGSDSRRTWCVPKNSDVHDRNPIDYNNSGIRPAMWIRKK